MIGEVHHWISSKVHICLLILQVLCGKDIPKWVNRLASIGSRFPLLYACIPKEWLTPEPMPSVSEEDLMEWVHIEGPGDGMFPFA